MFLNRESITKINELKSIVTGQSLAMAQTNSRLNGNYLKSIRIYNDTSDKGHPKRAIDSAMTLPEIEDLINKYSKE